jgi:hypothetical protein
MNILISTDGLEEGPFQLDELNQRLARNEIVASKTHAWYEGLPEWVPLTDVPGILVPKASVPPPLPKAKAPTNTTRAIVKAKNAYLENIPVSNNRKRIEYYFTGKLGCAVWAIVLGLPFLGQHSSGEAEKSLLNGLAILFMAGGIIAVFNHKKKMPSDKDIDAWFEEESRAFAGKALAKCGIDESECVADQVIVWGPRIFNHGDAPFLVKKGDDNVIRYNPLDLTIINFGADQLLCYQCCYDRTSGAFLMETTEEYFYQDVVSVATASDSTVKEIEVGANKVKVKSNSRETFRLTTSGGTSITVVLRDDGLIQMNDLKGGSMPTTQAEKAIQSVRRMLRDKKRL